MTFLSKCSLTLASMHVAVAVVSSQRFLKSHCIKFEIRSKTPLLYIHTRMFGIWTDVGGLEVWCECRMLILKTTHDEQNTSFFVVCLWGSIFAWNVWFLNLRLDEGKVRSSCSFPQFSLQPHSCKIPDESLILGNPYFVTRLCTMFLSIAG